jgi:hypothetical protein
VSPEVKPANDNPYDFRDKINPPSTTLPAALNVPERQPDQGTIKYYVSVGRSYWAFYKTGVKNVWRNGQERRRLVRRARASTHKTPPPAMPDTKQNTVLDERGLGQYENYPFTRAEFQFFTRAWRDAKRIPIFIILLAVFGEYLPLVVMFCTPLVPYTCRIPKQIQKAREKIEEKRSQSFRGQLGSVPTQHKNGTNEDVQKLEQLDAAQIDHLGRSLGLYFGFWDRLGAVWPPRMMLRKKVNKKLQYLELDDALFRRDGGVKLLNSEEEIKIAAEDRGIDILNRSTEEIQRLLEAWESGAKDGKTLSMLLSRYAFSALYQYCLDIFANAFADLPCGLPTKTRDDECEDSVRILYRAYSIHTMIPII